MSDPNLVSFRRPGIVSYYNQLQQLQPAEKVVLDMFSDRLSGMTFLDLGVGAGRTTPYIAPRVADYIGVDYSPEMIATCKQRYPETDRIRFQVCDVRDLSQFSDHRFDFIWFSFNGIDNISHTERLSFFETMTRLIKPQGYFFFSTHNLQGIEPDFSLASKLSWNPLTGYVNGVMWTFLRAFNRHLSPRTIQDLDHAIIRDESHNFRLRQYYIRPQAQLEQLAPYFHDITVYSWQTGEAIAPNKLEQQREMWLYYLCHGHLANL